MKKTLVLLFTIFSLHAIAQKANLPMHVSAQGTTIDVYLDSNNSKKVITLTSSKKGNEGRLVIMNVNAKSEVDFDRSYMLMSDKDEDLGIAFSSRMVGTIYALLTDIFAKAQKGKTYKLYTIATPKDPNIAATVRMRRILMCTVLVK